MALENFSTAALVILGHGTTQNECSAVPVRQHVATLSRRGEFAEVHAAFWKQAPHLRQVLTSIKAPCVFVVPAFISEGYFSQEIIPRDLGLDSDFSLQTTHFKLRYCRPIGTHDRMTQVILARAREVVEEHPFPRAPKPRDTTLFIAGHGTERSANSRAAIERQADLIRAQNIYAAVHAVFMEEDPRIAECYIRSQTRHLVIVPFFMSDGLHTIEDIPVLLGEAERSVQQRLAAGQPTWRNPTERKAKLVWYSRSVGSAPEIVEVILERVREAARRETTTTAVP